MADIELFVFLVVTNIIADAVAGVAQTEQCFSMVNGHWSNCYYGCCGNTTLKGFGTTPCCQQDDLPRYTYLLLGVGFLIPFIICMMILRRTGERCRNRNQPLRRSRRDENLDGTMPNVGSRRLMVTTIADLLSSSREWRRRGSNAEVVKPPSYEDVVKESQIETKPPAYSDVFVVGIDNLNRAYLTDENPPEYVQADNLPETNGDGTSFQQRTSNKSDTALTHTDHPEPCSSGCLATDTDVCSTGCLRASHLQMNNNGNNGTVANSTNIEEPVVVHTQSGGHEA